MFWTEREQKVIMRSFLNGSEPSVLIATDVGSSGELWAFVRGSLLIWQFPPQCQCQDNTLSNCPLTACLYVRVYSQPPLVVSSGCYSHSSIIVFHFTNLAGVSLIPALLQTFIQWHPRVTLETTVQLLRAIDQTCMHSVLTGHS